MRTNRLPYFLLLIVSVVWILFFPYFLLLIVSVVWILFFPYFQQDFLTQYYYMPFLGIIAATVANTTPAAAGIVYFPCSDPEK